jgi:ankyrin repeat protein
MEPDSTSVNAQGLLLAARWGEMKNVRKYLDLGTNIEVKNYQGLTSLQSASLGGYLDIVRLLLDRGANIEAAGGSRRQTSLMFASMNGRLSVVKELLDRGANIEAAEHPDGWTSLMFASFMGQLDVVKELLDRGANIFAKNVGGVTARQAAETKGFYRVAEYLREKEQSIGRKEVARIVVRNRRPGPDGLDGRDVPTDVQKKIVGYLGGRKKRTKRKIARRRKQAQKGTRRTPGK